MSEIESDLVLERQYKFTHQLIHLRVDAKRAWFDKFNSNGVDLQRTSQFASLAAIDSSQRTSRSPPRSSLRGSLMHFVNFY